MKEIRFMSQFTIVFVALFVFSYYNVKAQNIFNFVMQNAQKVVNNPLSTYTNTKINQFKITELNYLKNKMQTEKNDSNMVYVLDKQAYYMTEFLNTFFKHLVLISSKGQEEKKNFILKFMDASCSNPLFKDEDKELVDSYINDGNEFTPFCLDTDWEKASAAAKHILEEAKK